MHHAHPVRSYRMARMIRWMALALVPVLAVVPQSSRRRSRCRAAAGATQWRSESAVLWSWGCSGQGAQDLSLLCKPRSNGKS